MKKILILVAAMFAMTLTSCEPEGASNLSIVGSATPDGVIEFIVTSSSPKTTYVCGYMYKVVLEALGGESSLPAYINTELAKDPELHSGPHSFIIPADPLEYYYGWVAEVRNGKIVGEPVLSEAVKYDIPYKRVVPDQGEGMIAFSISDNGVYVVGNTTNESFIYNRKTDEITYVGAANLFDISDNGIAVGYNNDTFCPVIYDLNGNMVAETVSFPDNYTEATLWGITPDGSKCFGYLMLGEGAENPMTTVPAVYENGAWRELSMEGAIYGNSTLFTGSVSSGSVGSNGMCAGYVRDNKYWTYTGALWLADGTLVPMGNGISEYDQENDLPTHIFRGMFTKISPAGKYVSSELEDYSQNDFASISVYLYDTETKETAIAPSSDFSQMPLMTVSAVDDNGVVYISDIDQGLSSNPPYVWTSNGGLTLLEHYLNDTYDVDASEIKGNVMCTADNGRTIVVSGYTEEGKGTFFEIYSF